MKQLAVIFLLLLTPGLALSEEFQYSYVEAGYGKIRDTDRTNNEKGSAQGLDVNVAIHPNVYLGVGYGKATYDPDMFGSGEKSTGYVVAAGYHAPLNPRVDAVAELYYVRIKEQILWSSASGTGNGYGVDLGFRSWLAPGVELNVGVDYGRIAGSGSAEGRLGMAVRVVGPLSVTLDATKGSSTTFYGAGLRYYF